MILLPPFFFPLSRLALGLGLALALAVVGAASTPVRIEEYRVKGVTLLKPEEIEDAVYPFLGPARDPEDVERARIAITSVYQEKGYNTVVVSIPEQEVVDGVVRLEVNEMPVGRVRVKGARYTSPKALLARAGSLAEGRVINFQELPGDIARLNRQPGVQVTPAINPGIAPGTVDVDLNVTDRMPLRASVELNNHAGPNTKPLRANLGLRATNLFQKGHSLGFDSQVAPQELKQVKVFSAFYSFAPKSWERTSLLFSGRIQDSDVSTLGSANAVGRNRVGGLRLVFDLPSSESFFHTTSFGMDWKRLRLRTQTAGQVRDVPVTYFPLVGSYTATWTKGARSTELDAEFGAHLRGTGSGVEQFDYNRYRADGAYAFAKVTLAHTQPFLGDWQAYGRLTGQVAGKPLLSLEQLSAGGQSSVRGYLESEAVGDEGTLGTFELRTPNLAFWDASRKRDEVRFHAFLEGAYVTTLDVLFEQSSFARLASYGGGLSFQVGEVFSGDLEVGVPIYTQANSSPGEPRVTFRAAVAY